MSSNKGLVVIITAPGGTGKGTVIKKLLKENKHIKYSVSCTSRAKRENDAASNYHYITKEKFEKMIDNDQLFEYVQFCDNYYGTPKEFILNTIEQNDDIILELEYQGALTLKNKFPEARIIFLLPPTFNELKHRLYHRHNDDKDRIIQRLTKSEDEVGNAHKFDYLVINDILNDTIRIIETIIKFEKDRNSCTIDEIKSVESCIINKEANIKFINNFLKDIKNHNFEEV